MCGPLSNFAKFSIFSPAVSHGRLLNHDLRFFFLFPLELVNSDDPTLNFITNNPLDALLAVEIEKNKEFLLCFNCKYIRA